MITILGISIGLLILFIIYNKLNNKYQEEVFKNKMFKLRDDLRRLAIENKVNCKSIEFDYIDFSISKSIEQSYYITFFYIKILELRYSKSVNKLQSYKNVYDPIYKSIFSNPDLKKILNTKNKITTEYLLSQNRPFIFLLKKISWFTSNFFNVRKFIKNKISEINYLPELSGISLTNY